MKLKFKNDFNINISYTMNTINFLDKILDTKLKQNDRNLINKIFSFIKCEECNILNLHKDKCICKYDICILCKVNQKLTKKYLLCEKNSNRWFDHHKCVLCKDCYFKVWKKEIKVPSNYLGKCDVCNTMICIDCHCYKNYYIYCYDCYYSYK